MIKRSQNSVLTSNPQTFSTFWLSDDVLHGYEGGKQLSKLYRDHQLPNCFYQNLIMIISYLIVCLFLSLLRVLRILLSFTRSWTSENSLHFEIKAIYLTTWKNDIQYKKKNNSLLPLIIGKENKFFSVAIGPKHHDFSINHTHFSLILFWPSNRKEKKPYKRQL